MATTIFPAAIGKTVSFNAMLLALADRVSGRVDPAFPLGQCKRVAALSRIGINRLFDWYGRDFSLILNE